MSTKDEALKLALGELQAGKVGNAMQILREALAKQPAQQEPCGGCGGCGWVTRDPDIGTDQECFVCEGVGFIKPEQPAQQRGLEMVDDEGENRAVRMFLALYGGQYGVTAEQMRKHLSMSGFEGAWPEWANSHNGHLTKAGAQLWIRHLFSLEQPAQRKPLTEEEISRLNLSAVTTKDAISDVREVEAAHGIKGDA